MTRTRARRSLLTIAALLGLAVIAELAWLIQQGPRLAQAQAHADAMLREPEPSAKRRGLSMYSADDDWRMDAVSAIRSRRAPWLEAFIVDEGLGPQQAAQLRQVLALAVAKQINRNTAVEFGTSTADETQTRLQSALFQRQRVLRHLLGDERAGLLGMVVDMELAAELAPGPRAEEPSEAP